jgi:uncharacterized protein YecE (DUF72 family)
MIDWRIGTIGFGYDDWTGVFYPASVRPPDRLAYYARHFDAVELDATFHAAPDARLVQRWAEAVPAPFRFCVKTPRSVTHELPLQRALGPMLDFLNTLRGFGPKLAVVLVQFPPSFSAQSASELDAFLSAMPGDLRFAIELRNASWDVPQTLEILRRHRCCLVWAEHQTMPSRASVTTDFLYIRWIGRHGAFTHYAREQTDLTDNLKDWLTLVEQAAPRLPAPRTVYGFANNDYTGYAVGTSNRFKRLIGVEVPSTPADLQGRLFE